MYSLAVVLRGLRPRGTWRTRGGARQSARPGQGRHAARAGRLKRIATSVRKCRVAPALGALRTDLPPLPPVVGSSWLARPGGSGRAARPTASVPRLPQPMPSEDLHALVSGFADVAAAYERGRPDYPQAMVDVIAAELGDAARPPARVLDFGAGTGKLTRPAPGRRVRRRGGRAPRADARRRRRRRRPG